LISIPNNSAKGGDRGQRGRNLEAGHVARGQGTWTNFEPDLLGVARERLEGQPTEFGLDQGSGDGTAE
jgi:hypothetical protein